MDFKKIDFVKYAAMLVCFAGVIAVFYFAFRYIIWAILPFLIAWGIAFLIRPASEYLHKKTKFSRKPLNFILVLLAFFLLGSIIFLVINQAIIEIKALIYRLEEDPFIISDGFERIRDKIDAFRVRFQIFDAKERDTGESSFDEYVVSVIEKGVSTFLSGASKILGKLILFLPRALIFTLVSVISAFYFSMDLNNVNKGVLSILPKKWQTVGKKTKNTLFITGLKYLRAYLTIMLIVFSLLLIGFFMLKVKYAFIISLVCALVDFLPVLGVGSVLIPWSIASFAMGNLKLGIGLIVLYLVIAVIRQIIEPKIVGKNFGIHPLLTLFSMYLGLSFFGIFGMILGPLAAAVIKGSFFSKSEEAI